MEVLQGCLDALTGKAASFDLPDTDHSPAPVSAPVQAETLSTADIKFGYCTEFLIMLNKPMTEEDEEELKKYLLSIGDSLVCVADEEICKIHVHTNTPGEVITRGLAYGELITVKIENMKQQHRHAAWGVGDRKEPEKKPEPERVAPTKEFGFVAVAAGEGFHKLFEELGADRIVSGGQTMNPSTEDILTAVYATPARTVFVLPNNKNIVLAAQQAARLADDARQMRGEDCPF